MSESTQARDLAELGFLKQYLKEAGLQSELIEPSGDLPIGALLVPINLDDRERDRYLTFSFIPSLVEHGIKHIRLLQIYTKVPTVWKEENQEQVEKLLLAINCHLAIGHYSIREDGELYYRYVWCVSGSTILPKDELLEIIDVFMLMMDTFAEMIEGVASGRTELSAALAFLEQ
ncbi:hypothetical protein GC093_05640 [Paenibacillus sp. LMG 31456]|uniref:YbjN domain-containing protein n=1 Tax=Paenibacillus foliorum TaxID=2654974 RepID=A0A972GL50_9BACL|nr:YbjN domain-containing protein [Paenibacillus foliorum]NOU92712.1 hypothetical protein [Paenibacillus foliorum]